jgi:hypothetical protein
MTTTSGFCPNDFRAAGTAFELTFPNHRGHGRHDQSKGTNEQAGEKPPQAIASLATGDDRGDDAEDKSYDKDCVHLNALLATGSYG